MHRRYHQRHRRVAPPPRSACVRASSSWRCRTSALIRDLPQAVVDLRATSGTSTRDVVGGGISASDAIEQDPPLAPDPKRRTAGEKLGGDLLDDRPTMARLRACSPRSATCRHGKRAPRHMHRSPQGGRKHLPPDHGVGSYAVHGGPRQRKARSPASASASRAATRRPADRPGSRRKRPHGRRGGSAWQHIRRPWPPPKGQGRTEPGGTSTASRSRDADR